MDPSFTADQTNVQADVRSVLSQNLPAEISAKVQAGEKLSKAGMEQWHAILQIGGWPGGSAGCSLNAPTLCSRGSGTCRWRWH